MTERSNGTGEGLTLVGRRAWQTAEIMAGSKLLEALYQPDASPFYAYLTFVRERQATALGLTESPKDQELILARTVTDLSRMASYQTALTEGNRAKGISIIQQEELRIKALLQTKRAKSLASTLGAIRS